uniref:G_PROTEIN_RECEP_F1_2 domain-containing protein n=1 Tax=Steinernema glaseri TaxID=37863 RepID=A0A1I7YDS4_9BILA
MTSALASTASWSLTFYGVCDLIRPLFRLRPQEPETAVPKLVSSLHLNDKPSEGQLPPLIWHNSAVGHSVFLDLLRTCVPPSPTHFSGNTEFPTHPRISCRRVECRLIHFSAEFRFINCSTESTMSLRTFCDQGPPQNETVAEHDIDLADLKNMFRLIAMGFCAVGISGNVLNLITLRNPSLQTVPFMFIRALAVFDICGLSAIFLHYCLPASTDSYLLIAYHTYVEDVFINACLVAGLYCALLLTIERFVLIKYPHTSRLLNPENNARLKIFLSFFFALLLHSPIALQNKIKLNADGTFHKGNNQDLLCQDPYWSIFNYYKMIREAIRFFCVMSMVGMNAVITRKLQRQKKNRRQMVLRNNVVSATQQTSPARERQSRRDTSLLRSFTEKKLTALMISICFIYVIGNLPQTVVMVLQSETTEELFGFQVYRNIANTLEVVNHCMNFFIFCMASSEYTRAFLFNCLCLQRILGKVPFCEHFFRRQRMNRTLSTTDQISQNTTSSQYHLVGLMRKSMDSSSKTATTQLREVFETQKHSEDCFSTAEVHVVINLENSEGDRFL